MSLKELFLDLVNNRATPKDLNVNFTQAEVDELLQYIMTDVNIEVFKFIDADEKTLLRLLNSGDYELQFSSGYSLLSKMFPLLNLRAYV